MIACSACCGGGQIIMVLVTILHGLILCQLIGLMIIGQIFRKVELIRIICVATSKQGVRKDISRIPTQQ